ncbi:acetylxylan esterase [Sphingomonas sp. JC676]|uniref:alpha/beta hydrolase n=1 Tax=Sphingomonas sp. JC676 TaxID=2768065 RepID=UPI001657B2FF|nr:acetylxylan esterase [Sphingomonas sp. JC676]MBC9035096.1 acetylxylan esterase [Sphingomonas sp. JC676]
MAVGLTVQTASAQTQTARDRLVAYLTELAREQSAARAATVAALASSDEARLRQLRVRATIEELVRPERFGGPVTAAITRTATFDGYTTESLWYESLPGYRVTGIVYRPATGRGPFPAIILQPGHGSEGKLGNHLFAANFARAGFIVLSIDIVGEGERLQHYDPEIGASKVGRPTGEHSMAFGQALPTGGHVARYFLQDAVRGVDYLMSRADVDDRRIGAFGCSGGGTMTAYLAALDIRIRAAAVGCYVNDFDHLLATGGPGPQDAEQSIPFFLERGLDLPDWIELVAPRPFAILSTTGDMFPIAGARAAYAEAGRFYELLGARDRLAMIEGPGGHGNLAPMASRIIGFFNRWLKDVPDEAPFAPAPLPDPSALLVTDTGQLATSGGGMTLQAVIAREASRQVPSARPIVAQLRAAIAQAARTSVTPGAAAPAMREGARQSLDGYGVTPVQFDAAPGLHVDGLYAQSAKPGKRPTLLYLASQPLRPLSAPGGMLEHWTRGGWNVLALEARGANGTEEVKSSLTGDWTLLSLRALLVGKTPLGMRVDDAISALNWLAERPEVDRRSLEVYGLGALGPVALHAAVLDPRVAHVVSDGAILRYRDFVERPVSRDMAEVNLPGVLEQYDIPDLIAALGERVTLVNPVNAVGEPLSLRDVHAIAGAAVRLRYRGTRDPIAPPSDR